MSGNPKETDSNFTFYIVNIRIKDSNRIGTTRSETRRLFTKNKVQVHKHLTKEF